MTVFMQRSVRPIRREAATHIFAVGQAVRLKGGFGMFPKTVEIYHVTGTLPPKGGSPQYRIRNDGERHERVTTQDSLEPVDALLSGDSITLIESTFGLGHGAKALKPRDQKASAKPESTFGSQIKIAAGVNGPRSKGRG